MAPGQKNKINCRQGQKEDADSFTRFLSMENNKARGAAKKRGELRVSIIKLNFNVPERVDQEEEAQKFSKGIVESEKYLHQVGEMHNDIQLGNILVTDALELKLSYRRALKLWWQGTTRRKTKIT
jgi:hypothetical protein